jgi:hypothetical protein
MLRGASAPVEQPRSTTNLSANSAVRAPCVNMGTARCITSQRLFPPRCTSPTASPHPDAHRPPPLPTAMIHLSPPLPTPSRTPKDVMNDKFWTAPTPPRTVEGLRAPHPVRTSRSRRHNPRIRPTHHDADAVAPSPAERTADPRWRIVRSRVDRRAARRYDRAAVIADLPFSILNPQSSIQTRQGRQSDDARVSSG